MLLPQIMFALGAAGLAIYAAAILATGRARTAWVDARRREQPFLYWYVVAYLALLALFFGWSAANAERFVAGEIRGVLFLALAFAFPVGAALIGGTSQGFFGGVTDRRDHPRRYWTQVAVKAAMALTALVFAFL